MEIQHKREADEWPDDLREFLKREGFVLSPKPVNLTQAESQRTLTAVHGFLEGAWPSLLTPPSQCEISFEPTLSTPFYISWVPQSSAKVTINVSLAYLVEGGIAFDDVHEWGLAHELAHFQRSVINRRSFLRPYPTALRSVVHGLAARLLRFSREAHLEGDLETLKNESWIDGGGCSLLMLLAGKEARNPLEAVSHAFYRYVRATSAAQASIAHRFADYLPEQPTFRDIQWLQESGVCIGLRQLCKRAHDHAALELLDQAAVYIGAEVDRRLIGSGLIRSDLCSSVVTFCAQSFLKGVDARIFGRLQSTPWKQV